MKWVEMAASVPVCEFNGQEDDADFLSRLGVDGPGLKVQVVMKKVVWKNRTWIMEICADTPILEPYLITREEVASYKKEGVIAM